MAQVEWETLQWVSWYNTERLYGAIGHRPPQEMEDAFHASMNTLDPAYAKACASILAFSHRENRWDKVA